MEFSPKTEEEVVAEQSQFGPFPKGQYEVQVTEAQDTKSQKGVDQIHLVCRIFNEERKYRTVHDYLHPAMSAKLRHFCQSAGLMEEYESGRLSAADCAGQELRCEVKIEKGKGEYDDRNVITDYLPRQKVASGNGASIPAASSSSGAMPTAKDVARKNFMVRFNLFLNEFPDQAGSRDKFWGEAFKVHFNGKNPASISSTEWMGFAQALKEWDPINGFKAKSPVVAGIGSRPTQASPLSEEAVFQDDDIPFAWEGRHGQML